MPVQEIRIRPFIDNDRPAIVSLWNKVFESDPSWNEAAEMIRIKKTVQPELFLVAVLNNQIIGTVMAGFDGVRGWIHRLAVHPSNRRTGVAAELMRVAEEQLQALGCPKVNLQVRSDNEGVVAFYRKQGYEVEPRVSMGKRLKA